MLQLACKGWLACNNKNAKDNKHVRDNKKTRDNKQARCSQHIGQDGNMVQQWYIIQYSDGYSHD